ncbi:adenylate/guanylate cyclase domain-containing protein [Candidatus Halobeggiatoa sp. HSG11]|nr:adenylate/guanylate cyclase domain-containing protein [Candidatus Halobeggiatoa sp. HSG11]
MNIDILTQKIAILKKRPLAFIPAIEAIHNRLLQSSKAKFQQRISPTDIDLPINKVVPELLHSIPIGLFDLNWEVHCPHCHGITHDYHSLSQAAGESYCENCRVEFEADFAKWVNVTFSLNKEIDNRKPTLACKLPEGTEIFLVLETAPSETKSAIMDIKDAGKYRYVCPMTKSRGMLTISGEKTDELQEFSIEQLINNEFNPSEIQAHPGRIKINLTNSGYVPSGLIIIIDNLPQQPLPPNLSGLELIHYPEFHNLFGEQVLSNREQMQVAAVTTLFTDITGSTEMYEKLGDIAAYNVVRDHFDILFSYIEQQGGIILKTIGDAVMASFTSNEAALLSIINALEEFEQYNNNKHIDRQVNIKIGIHRGPTILVNLNERLDYFGSTINKAARIQAVANSGEICFSEQVYQDSNFVQAMKRSGIENISRHSINLKGIDGLQTVYKAVTKLNSLS